VLIRKLVQHWVDRYGLDEVWYWFFEVWSEQIWRPSAAADKTNISPLAGLQGADVAGEIRRVLMSTAG